MKNTNYAMMFAMATLSLAACKGVSKLSSYAEKDLSSKARYDVSKSKIRENGRGFTVDFAKLPKSPKRIALVSFYVEDPGLTKVSGTRSTGRTYRTTNTSQEGVRQYANYYYKLSMDTMRQVFKGNDMEILTPSQFASAGKAQYYRSFEAKHSTLNKLGGKLTSFFKGSGDAGTTIETKEPADGFTLCNMNSNRFVANAKHKSVKTNGGVGEMDDKLIESMGSDLCKELDVDAVLVVVNTMLCDSKHRKDRHFLSAVSMYMFGPNPLPLAEGKKDNMFYSKGLFYSGYRMAFKKGLCLDPKIKDEAKKTANEKLNEKAYNNIVASLAGNICSNIKEK